MIFTSSGIALITFLVSGTSRPTIDICTYKYAYVTPKHKLIYIYIYINIY